MHDPTCLSGALHLFCCSQSRINPKRHRNDLCSVPGWSHIGAAFEMIDLGRRSVGAHFVGARYAHGLLGFFLLIARFEEKDANLIAIDPG